MKLSEIMEMVKKTGAGAQMSEQLRMELAREKVPKEVIDGIELAMKHSDCNPYAQSYAHMMTQAWDEGGLEGIEVQILYLLNNMAQWKGEEARNTKKLLKKWQLAQHNKRYHGK